ncbi:MAG: terminase small subunit [Mucilaginibacter sp.]|uniref:terminase small subunit n=1 Tax=Mucilaginibacter sp. TaxID=1882438 RepID=UPI003264414F
MNNSENLTLQQQRFCDEYLVSFNAYRAALCAGYSETTAKKAELLHQPKIQAYLKAGMAKNAERLQVSHDMILRELAKIAFSNMGNYYDDNATLKPMSLLTSDEKAAISHYQIMDSTDEYGNRVGELSRIKLHNKMSALDKIARHVGFYGVKTQESGCKNQEEELKAESLKHKAVSETQESGCKNQDEDGLLVNGEGELVAEAATEDVVMLIDAGALHNSSARAGKILTLSPLVEVREADAEVYVTNLAGYLS